MTSAEKETEENQDTNQEECLAVRFHLVLLHVLHQAAIAVTTHTQASHMTTHETGCCLLQIFHPTLQSSIPSKVYIFQLLYNINK